MFYVIFIISDLQYFKVAMDLSVPNIIVSMEVSVHNELFANFICYTLIYYINSPD